jgi:hypothetical protein
MATAPDERSRNVTRILIESFSKNKEKIEKIREFRNRKSHAADARPLQPEPTHPCQKQKGGSVVPFGHHQCQVLSETGLYVHVYKQEWPTGLLPSLV